MTSCSSRSSHPDHGFPKLESITWWKTNNCSLKLYNESHLWTWRHVCAIREELSVHSYRLLTFQTTSAQNHDVNISLRTFTCKQWFVKSVFSPWSVDVSQQVLMNFHNLILGGFLFEEKSGAWKIISFDSILILWKGANVRRVGLSFRCEGNVSSVEDKYRHSQY